MKNKPTVILGVNTSHDTAVAVVEDGIVKHVYEEERSRRSKYWSPSEDNNGDEPYEELGLVCIEHKQLHSPDYLAFASFDRRDFKVNVTDKVKHDRELQQALIKDISSQQLSYEHLVSIQSEYGSSVFQKNTRKEDEDEYINKSISQQVQPKNTGVEFKPEHHYFHAVCGSHLSPYEEAICITWDGGGWNTYFEDWPGYQEIECIWHYKNEEVTPLYKRYSNHRFLSDLRNEMNMGGWGEDPLMCMNDETYDYDGVESVFSSLPSMGMNFSNMSYALGCDEMGRAAGKVMGMASYGTLQPDGSMGNIWNKHTTANKLEHDSLDHAQTVIQKALDLVPNCKNIVLSGGFSLNCTNNAKYLKLFPDVQFFVDPIPHDGGTAVGAALDMHRSILKGEENATDTNS
jgi:predicted NodU family carbamoyl transferase